ncbi:MAG TPA: hypothetical protein VGP43_02510 [Chitinophagaceae bacterium]|nr:hypothetical protein [Chitinophagaceae bacterium]
MNRNDKLNFINSLKNGRVDLKDLPEIPDSEELIKCLPTAVLLQIVELSKKNLPISSEIINEIAQHIRQESVVLRHKDYWLKVYTPISEPQL